jgi:predicted HD superfamily hydrolase involved in NAD metabolism
MRLDELAVALEGRLDATLSEARARHSRGVATLAAELCGRSEIEPSRGLVAGLSHDLCKELPLGEQRELAAKSPYFGGRAGLLSPELLHGPAAAYLLARDFDFAETDILEAVAYHTVGRPDMSELDIIVYCADKIEPGRAHVDDAFRRRCLALPPSQMLLAVMENTMAWLNSKGRVVAPETLLLYNSLRKSVPTL